MTECPHFSGLLILPRLRVQNANAISSSMTWGFPSMTAFLGLMWALERKIAGKHALSLNAVGVVCHSFEPQVDTERFIRAFTLTRNPVTNKKNIGKDGQIKNPDSIAEEGRAHLDLTLIFAVAGKVLQETPEDRAAVALSIATMAAAMRIAGGSIIPSSSRQIRRPELIPLAEGEERAKQFRQLHRRWLPGFTLVKRDDLLQDRFQEMRKNTNSATLLDAWLDISQLNWDRDDPTDENGKTEWLPRRRAGWLVPIPVGYAALSELYPPKTVKNTRDAETPFRFVESLYSIGQWLGPHRLTDVSQMLWYGCHDADSYLCGNDYIV